MTQAVTRIVPFTFCAVLSCTARKTDDNLVPLRSGSDVAAVGNSSSTPRKSDSSVRKTPEPTKPGRVTRIPLGDLFQLQQQNRVLIFDVRPAFIYKLGHIPGAVNWPKANFDSRLPIHEPQIAAAKASGTLVVLYCVDLACPDARTVAGWLSARGHSVSILEGGWDAWKIGGLPTE